MTRATQIIFAGIATAGAVLLGSGAHAQLPTHHDLSYAVALAIAVTMR